MPSSTEHGVSISHVSMNNDPNVHLLVSGGTEPNQPGNDSLAELGAQQYQSTFKVYSDRHAHQIAVSQHEAQQPSVPGLVIG